MPHEAPRLRVFPQLAQVDPRAFQLDVGALEQAAAAPLRTFEAVQESGVRQRARNVERATFPQRLELAGMQATEAVEEFPTQRAARAAQTRRQLSEAEAGAVAADIDRDIAEQTRDLRRGAEVLELGAAREAAGTRTIESVRARRPRYRRMVETPEGSFTEEVIRSPDGTEEVLSRIQTATPEQLQAQREQQAAQTRYTEARATAAGRVRPNVSVQRSVSPTGALQGVNVTIVDPTTGEVETQFMPIDAAGGAPGGMQIPGGVVAPAPAPAPTARTATPAPTAAVTIGSSPATVATTAPRVAAQPGANAQGGYLVGGVYAGLRYLGGDPNQATSWQPIQ